ncbi:MAG: InlB B-repeat-containing protein [Clostridia bacterium]|nr:InlB B-repeat-containing protein [Clostridia bacterium]
MKHEKKLELISGIDEKIIDRNTKKRNDLWYKALSKSRRGGRSKNIAIILLAATLALTMLAFGGVLILHLSDEPTVPPVPTDPDDPSTPTESILSIELTSTVGDKSVYTITYGNGSTATLDITDQAPDGSGAKITGVTFDENSNVYLSLATGKLLNMGSAVGQPSETPTLQGNHSFATLSATHYTPLRATAGTTTVIGVSVNAYENMSYQLNNGKQLAFGKIHNKSTEGKDESMSMACINESGELVLGFASGETVNLGRVVGRDGKDGVGIEGINVTEEGELSVTLTNGTVLNLGNIKGIGIAESKINDAGELVLTYTDGNTVNLGRVVGEKGEDGVGIASININDAGELTISLTDGTNLNLGVIKGQDGKSAYELYKEKYGYEGTEEEWLFDLVNGNLATKVKYPVTFDSAGGSEVPTQEIEEGGKVIEPEIPTRAGYTFLGWYYGEEPWSFAGYSVTEPITLTAKWEINTYNIVYRDVYPKEKNVGKTSYTVEDEIKVQDLAYYMEDDGKSLEGRTFLGWTCGDVKTPTKDLVIPKGTTGNLIVKAHWDVQEKFQFYTSPAENMKNIKTVDTDHALWLYTDPASKVYAVCDGVISSVKQEGGTYTIVICMDYDLSGKRTVTYKGMGTLAKGVTEKAHVSAGDVLGYTIDASYAYVSLSLSHLKTTTGAYFTVKALESTRDYGANLVFTAQNLCELSKQGAANLKVTLQDGYARLNYKVQEDYPYPNFRIANGMWLDFTPKYLVIKYRTTNSPGKNWLHLVSDAEDVGQKAQIINWEATGAWETMLVETTHLTENNIELFLIDFAKDMKPNAPSYDFSLDIAYIGFFDRINDDVATEIKHPVTFDSAGGTEVPTQKIKTGGKVVEPAPPTKDGYAFLGWYCGEERWSFVGYSITEAVTLTAKWEMLTYTVTYRDVYPAETKVGKTTYTIEDSITVKNLDNYYMSDDGKSLEGRTFLGWIYGSMTTPTKDLIIPEGTWGNLTVTACWDVQETFQFTVAPVDNMKSIQTYETEAFCAYTSPNSRVYAVCDGVITSVMQEWDTYTLILALDYDRSGQRIVMYSGMGTLADGITQGVHVSAGDVLGQTVNSSLAYVKLSFQGVEGKCQAYFSAQALESIRVDAKDYGEHCVIMPSDMNEWQKVGNTSNVSVLTAADYVSFGYFRDRDEHSMPGIYNDNFSLSFLPEYFVIRYRTTRGQPSRVYTGFKSFALPEWNDTGEWANIVADITPYVYDDLWYFELRFENNSVIPEEGEHLIDIAYMGFFDSLESAHAFVADFG